MGPSCQVYFKEGSEADMAVEMLNGRMFGRKVLTTNLFCPTTFNEAGDGGGDMGWSDKVQNEESKEEEAKRLEEWENYLKEGGDKKPLEAP